MSEGITKLTLSVKQEHEATTNFLTMFRSVIAIDNPEDVDGLNAITKVLELITPNNDE